jgi:hypothetical protein
MLCRTRGMLWTPAPINPFGQLRPTDEKGKVLIDLGPAKAESFYSIHLEVWWARQDSNLEPIDYEPIALTIELRAL